jgi:hypothetical protein
MKYIALTGQIASGKTAVAKALEAKGYMLISYTDLLKKYTVKALAGAGFYITLEGILANKEVYRGLLQELGAVVGFDTGSTFVAEALAEWVSLGRPPAVFDNVRTDAQADCIADYGFTVVELGAHLGTRTARIRAAGEEPARVLLRGNHPIERGISEEFVDMAITTDITTPNIIADFLASYDYFDEDTDADDDDDPYASFDGHPDDARNIERLANGEA